MRVPRSRSPHGADDGLRVSRSHGNRFEGNDVRDGFDDDCHDTLPNENTWIDNRGERSNPEGICGQP